MLGSVDAVKDHKSQRFPIHKIVLMVLIFVAELAGSPKFTTGIYVSLVVRESPVKCI